jgi:O-antigen/teichoic acid export membrane protein
MKTSISSPKNDLFRVWSFLRSRPGRPETIEDHSRERYRRAAMSGISASLSKVISLGTSILTVRLTYQYLGAERYGIWMTITSIVIMMTFADLGIGRGLINLVADALGHGDQRTAREAVSSAFFVLSAMAVLFTAIGALIYPHIDASRLLNVHTPEAAREAGPALAVFVISFCIQLPLGVIVNAQSGLQKGFLNNVWASIGALMSLGGVLLTIHFKGGLPSLVLSITGPVVLAALMNGVELFGFSHRELLPSIRFISRKTMLRLLHTGMMFFLQQLGYSVGMQTDNVVIAQIMGPKAVADYAVPARLFSIILAFLVMVSVAMWPAYADANARSDGAWIRKSFLRVTTWGTAVTIVSTIFLIFFGNRILAVWVGPQMHASPALLAAFALQCVVYAYLQPVNFLLNAIGQFRVQVICGLVMAAVNLTLSILLVRQFGIIGAVLGTVISLILVQVVPLTMVTKKVLAGF